MNAREGDPGQLPAAPRGPVEQASEFSVNLENNRAVLTSRSISIAKGEKVDRRFNFDGQGRSISSFNHDFHFESPETGVFVMADNPKNSYLSESAANEFSLRAARLNHSELNPGGDRSTVMRHIHGVMQAVDTVLEAKKKDLGHRQISEDDANVLVRVAGVVRIGQNGDRYAIVNSGKTAAHVVGSDGEIQATLGEARGSSFLSELDDTSFSPKHLKPYTVSIVEAEKGESIVLASDGEVARSILENTHPKLAPNNILARDFTHAVAPDYSDLQHTDKDVSIITIDLNQPAVRPYEQVHALSPEEVFDTDSTDTPPRKSRADEILDALTDSPTTPPGRQGLAALLAAMGDSQGTLLNRALSRRSKTRRNLATQALGALNRTIITGVMGTGNFLYNHRMGALGTLGAIGIGLVVARYGFDADMSFLPDNPIDTSKLSGQANDLAHEAWDKVFGKDITVITEPTAIEIPNTTTAPLEQWTGNIDPKTQLFDGTASDAISESVAKVITDHNLQNTIKGEVPAETLHEYVTSILQENGKTLEDAQLAQPGDTFTINGQALGNYLKEQGATLETPGGTETRHQNGNIWYGLALAGGLIATTGIVADSLRRVVKRIRR